MNKIGGYVFKNENLLKLATTHASYSKDNYERLEFLGDSILDFLVAKYFYFSCTSSEGELTKKRAYFVSEQHLCEIFNELEIEQYMTLGKSCQHVTNSIKCDVVEAIIGAIYVESGLDECEKFINNNLKLNKKIQSFIDHKSRLQEYAQSHGLEVKYNLLQIMGQAHDPEFEIECICDDLKTTQKGKTKQQAQQECAKAILDMINKEQKA